MFVNAFKLQNLISVIKGNKYIQIQIWPFFIHEKSFVYLTGKCNGTIIEVPQQFLNDVPIDVEIELTCKYAYWQSGRFEFLETPFIKEQWNEFKK